MTKLPRRTSQREVVSGVWIGNKIIPLANACMNSFLSMGHEFHLYTYNDVEDVPSGVIVEDADSIVSRDQIFRAHGGWEVFTDRVAYHFLRLKGGWWVDSGDVVCNSSVLPKSELFFAEEIAGIINNAALRFPEQHFAICRLIEYVNTVDSVTAPWGATGPRALSKVFKETGMDLYKADPSLIYPLYWKECPKLLFPEFLNEVKTRARESPLMHLWGSALREIGFHNEMKPIKGSYIDELFTNYLDPAIYDRLAPADESTFRAAVEDYVRKEWGVELALAERPSVSLMRPEGRITLQPPFTHEPEHCWLWQVSDAAHATQLRAIADEESAPYRSTVRLYEDGTTIGPGHALHDAIRQSGGGTFSHWKETLYFSSSDGTNPNVNGRRYEIGFDATLATGRSPDSRALRLSEVTCRSLAHLGYPALPWKSAQLGENVFAYRVPNVLYFPEYGFPLCGDFVPEESINHRGHLEMRRFGDAIVYPEDCIQSSSDACILGNIFSRVFGHWMEELLKVAMLESFGFEGVYVLGPLYPDFCHRSLQLLGIAAARVVVAERMTAFPNAYFVTNVSHMNAHRYPSVIRRLRNLLYDAVGPGSGIGERIWVERGAAQLHRQSDLVNREEAEAILKRYGFEFVDFASLNFAKQIEIDRDVDILAGIHGSAMVHCGFMKDGGHVIEAFSPNYINPSVTALCLALGHTYNQIVQANAYMQTDQGNQGVLLDVIHLETILRSRKRMY